MRRPEAISRAAGALSREHTPAEYGLERGTFGHQAVCLVDALEALGVIHFYEPMNRAQQGAANPQYPAGGVTPARVPFPGEVVAKHINETWVASTDEGAKVIAALEAAGYQVTRSKPGEPPPRHKTPFDVLTEVRNGLGERPIRAASQIIAALHDAGYIIVARDP